jgi:multidrug efflux pump subunit AcrB
MRKITEFMIKKHTLATMITMIVIFLGGSSLVSMKKEIFPPIESQMIEVSTLYYGGSSSVVEQNVTNKIEKAIKNVKNIKKIESESTSFISLIYAKLESGLSEKEEDDAIQDVKDAITQINDLPVELKQSPKVTKLNEFEFPLMSIALQGKVDKMKLRKIAKRVEKQVRRVKGVKKVETVGMPDRQFKVNVSAKSLEKHDITLYAVIMAMESASYRGSAGEIKLDHKKHSITIESDIKKVENALNIPITSNFSGQSILLKDIATIEDGFEDEDIISKVNSVESLTIRVFKTDHSDVVDVDKKIFKVLDEIKSDYNGEIQFEVTDRLAPYITTAYDIVKNNALTGFILVIIVLTVFLSVKLSFWVAMGLPFSVLGGIFVLDLMGKSIDIMSLSAMILVMGILVDDAIVIAESIYKEWESGSDPVTAGANGLSRVIAPVITSVLTTVLAFSPLLFIKGVEADFMRGLPIVVMVTLIISLFEGIFLLPAHISHSLSKTKRVKEKSLIAGTLSKFERGYGVLLTKLLKRRAVVVVSTIALFVTAIMTVSTIGKFKSFPDEAANEFYVYITTDEKNDIEQTEIKVLEFESLLDGFKKKRLVESYVTRIGTHDLGVDLPNQAVISVKLIHFSKRELSGGQIITQIEELAKDIKNMRFRVDLEGTGPSPKRDLEFFIMSNVDSERDAFTKKLFTHLEKHQAISQLEIKGNEKKDQLFTSFDKHEIAKYGLTLSSVMNGIRNAYMGVVTNKVQIEGEEVPYIVSIDKKERDSSKFIKNIHVSNSLNRNVKLTDIVTFSKEARPVSIRHYDNERVYRVTANLNQNLVSKEEFLKSVKSFLRPGKEFPSVAVELKGGIVSSGEAMGKAKEAFVVALVLIYIILYLLFNSFVKPVYVLLAVPFALMGVIFVFTVHGAIYSFPAALGFIGLTGVVVNDSLLLISEIMSGDKINDDIIVKKSVSRFRAIILTTLTSSLGLIPLAYGLGGEDPMNAPMALALGWGVFISTALILLVIPIIVSLVTELGVKFGHKGKNIRVDGETIVQEA